MPDRETFMAGVQAGWAFLREAERACREEDVSLLASYRDGRPQKLILAPLLQRLAEKPELLPGVDAVLSSYIGHCAGGWGQPNLNFYEALTYDEIMDPTPEPEDEDEDEPVSNVVQLRAAG